MARWKGYSVSADVSALFFAALSLLQIHILELLDGLMFQAAIFGLMPLLDVGTEDFRQLNSVIYNFQNLGMRRKVAHFPLLYRS